MWLKKEAPGAVYAMEHDWQVRQVAPFRQTLELMARKVPAIAKAALWWHEEQIYGSSDLICRTSWLYQKFPHLRPADYESEPDHYVIMDMKYTSGLHLPRKRDDLEMYACQMRIYSYALGHLQGYMPKRAYIISRDRIFDPIPVEINHELNKPLDKALREYRNQYRRIKLRGDRLKPWQDKEVAVNPGNKEDFPWHGAKEVILTQLVKGQSLMMLPGIGNKLADALEDAGYDCLADMLAKKPEEIPLEAIDGIGPVMAARIRAVLKANRSKKATKIPIHVVPGKAQTELFVDYEYFSNINVDMEQQWPILEGHEMVFLIGVGWIERGKWRYQQFVAEAETHKAERQMFRQFMAFLETKGVFAPNRTAALYHWSDAEPSQTREAIERHGGALTRLAKLPWCDLLTEVFYAVPLAFPGMWKYRLKDVSAALSEYSPEHRVEWPHGLTSGQAAQVAGWEAYRQAKPLETKEMILLSKYLEADVKALWSLLWWLRANVQPVRTATATTSRASGWYHLGLLLAADSQVIPEMAGGWYTSWKNKMKQDNSRSGN